MYYAMGEQSIASFNGLSSEDLKNFDKFVISNIVVGDFMKASLHFADFTLGRYLNKYMRQSLT